MSSGTFVTPFLPTSHFVLDLETTSTETGSAIVSIGLVQILKKNNNSTQPEYVTEPLYAAYYTVLGVPDQLSRGLVSDPDTEAFWQTVSVEARAEYEKALADPSDPILRLRAVVRWISDSVGVGIEPIIWGNSPGFDCNILAHVLKVYGVNVPWKFRNERDVRTVSKLHKTPIEKIKPALPHHALSDALAEANTLIKIEQRLPDTMSLFL